MRNIINRRACSSKGHQKSKEKISSSEEVRIRRRSGRDLSASCIRFSKSPGQKLIKCSRSLGLTHKLPHGGALAN